MSKAPIALREVSGSSRETTEAYHTRMIPVRLWAAWVQDMEGRLPPGWIGNHLDYWVAVQEGLAYLAGLRGMPT